MQNSMIDKQFIGMNIIQNMLADTIQSNLFDEIALYDIVHVPGIATDLMHIDTKAKVTGYLPADDGLKKALTGADVIVVTAGIARKPGMTRDGE